MKKFKYIIAATCVILGASGLAGIFAVDQIQNKDEIVRDSESEESETQSQDQIGKGDNTQTEDSQKEDSQKEDSQKEDSQKEDVAETKPPKETEEQQAPVAKPEEEVLHFSPEKGLVWPVPGEVLLDYSMDKSVYFPTLNQYQYHPAMVIAAKVNDRVYAMAKGVITDISTNEVTGLTVTQDVGDGYSIIYGQLKELAVEVGDKVESGKTIGYVSEPTKYYALEGPNVYFQILKDGVPVDPKSILPQEGDN